MPRFSIHHLTKYLYESPVRDSANQVVLFPIQDEFQEVLKHELVITGDPNLDMFADYYHNEVGTFMNAEPHTELLIDSKLEVITKPRPRPADEKDKELQWARIVYSTVIRHPLLIF